MKDKDSQKRLHFWEKGAAWIPQQPRAKLAGCEGYPRCDDGY